MRRARWMLGAVATVIAVTATLWGLWDPGPTSRARFDRGTNGLWAGHQWATGLNVQTDEPIDPEERAGFLRRLRDHHIGVVFVHAGPVRADGSIDEAPGEFFFELRGDASEVTFLPWLGAGVDVIDLASPEWRRAFIDTVEGLRELSIPGVHLDFEPIEDEDDGYVQLLREMRASLGPDYTISHATRRAGPWGVSWGPMETWFWSEELYRATMEQTDQTVLMAYDTTLDVRKHYVAFVRHQTELLLDWGSAHPGHSIMIGIPSYEDMPHISNPEVENIANAALGVRAALEINEAPCFDGVAIYAEWVTDSDEWAQYRSTWLAE